MRKIISIVLITLVLGSCAVRYPRYKDTNYEDRRNKRVALAAFVCSTLFVTFVIIPTSTWQK